MKRLLPFAVCSLWAIALVGCDKPGSANSISGTAPPSSVGPRENLDTAIDDAIKLLEAKSYKAFGETYIMSPEAQKNEKLVKDMKNLDDPKVIEKEGPYFSQIIDVLKSMKTQKPVMSANDTEAEYDVTRDRVKEKAKWKKYDKFWYLEL